MVRSLPPLNALRAFASVAKHLNMSKAALELHVTHAAVSQQITLLENHLGIDLLVRKGKNFTLSELGKEYAEEIAAAFKSIHFATERLHQQSNPNVLTLQIMPTLAVRWLIPRLENFQSTHKKIDIHLATHSHEKEGHVDLAIKYGHGSWEGGVHSEILFRDFLYPVCHPKLLTTIKKHGFSKTKLIYVSSDIRINDWPQWLKVAKIPEPQKSSRLYFQSNLQALQAATNGLGVMIAHEIFVIDAIKSGQLAVPFDLKVKAKDDFYLICSKSITNTLKIRDISKWLQQEASKSIPA